MLTVLSDITFSPAHCTSYGEEPNPLFTTRLLCVQTLLVCNSIDCMTSLVELPITIVTTLSLVEERPNWLQNHRSLKPLSDSG